MARQIARLQLPVLRVALGDATFFSSRRHPVRRFVNRIASLACAFDDFDDGPGKQFLDRVRELVQEIVEGDFDQIELYEREARRARAFIAEQTEREVADAAATPTTARRARRSELRMQQRYMLQLQRGARRRCRCRRTCATSCRRSGARRWCSRSRRDGADSDRAQALPRASAATW